MAESIKIQLPLKDADLERLHAGDHVLLSGVIYSARDAAHRRMIASLQKGEELPFDIRGQTLYYVGPTPARPGRVIGSAGPTTTRLDAFTPALLEAGLKRIIAISAVGKAAREGCPCGRLPAVEPNPGQHR